MQFQGAATATANGDETSFAATLGVIGGTGRYAHGHRDRDLHRLPEGGAGHDGGGDVRPDHRGRELT